MPSLGIVFSVTFRIVLLRALNLAHFSDYFVRQPYIFWRELLRQQRESTTTFCSRRQQAEDLVVLCPCEKKSDLELVDPAGELSTPIYVDVALLL